MPGIVYLIPTVLHDDEQALKAIPTYIVDAVKNCTTFFVENERTARRYLKKIWREMVIDEYTWHTIHQAEEDVQQVFISYLKQDKNIGIISEAGCPGIADPGQLLVAAAQGIGTVVKPLVGPSSILLALMASGMNGQCFQFHGYLPIDTVERRKRLKELESDSQKRHCTQIFIETPYRNNALVQDVLQSLQPQTKLCIAVDITAASESIITKTIATWKKGTLPNLHKHPAIFLLDAGKS
jgi:16S rRNA (cytidine1402-2'-O)-methyltransferase